MHVAFVFDRSLRRQIIYLNGYIDGQATLPESSLDAYMGAVGQVNIGTEYDHTDLYSKFFCLCE